MAALSASRRSSTMVSLRRPHTRVHCALLAVALGGLGLAWLLTRSSTAHAASVGQVQQQISGGQDRISNLSGALNSVSSHLSQLNASVASLEQRITQIRRDLDAKRAELL